MRIPQALWSTVESPSREPTDISSFAFASFGFAAPPVVVLFTVAERVASKLGHIQQMWNPAHRAMAVAKAMRVHCARYTEDMAAPETHAFLRLTADGAYFVWAHVYGLLDGTRMRR